MASRKRERPPVVPDGEIDPAVLKVHKSLEQVLAQFMSSVGDLCRTYEGKLQAAMPFNPKARFFDDGPTTPHTPGALGGADQAPERTTTPRPATPLLHRPSRVDSSAFVGTPGAHGASTSDFPVVPPADLPPSTVCNPNIIRQLRFLKREATALVKTFEQIHDWVALNIPQVNTAGGDEGNLEGSDMNVMGVVISNCEEMSSALRSVCMLEKKYLADRADLEGTASKYPEATSCERAFAILDSVAWDDIERGWRALIRSSLLLHSVLAKNLKKLQGPSKDGGASAGSAPHIW